MELGPEENLDISWTLLSWVASGVMVFGGAVPYIPQYQEIQRSTNAEGFSTRVCLVLIIANILRIFFWSAGQDFIFEVAQPTNENDLMTLSSRHTPPLATPIYSGLVITLLSWHMLIGKQFELPLLLQSVVMILTMLAMLQLCCSVQSSNRVSTKQHHITGNHESLIWSDITYTENPSLI
ncbi:hypothetical protein DNTS_009279 [Danionella cerebrum]|uniref:PQ-loop repeat-containing protein 1 n=1 Tax=Danionella cerebrum TaxID=2873325 RepID=A0A553Q5P7_9TELE|nr:hypothetical protein DNTS_009279 [Danionella translucida]